VSTIISGSRLAPRQNVSDFAVPGKVETRKRKLPLVCHCG
jgi:hypothetical protein